MRLVLIGQAAFGEKVLVGLLARGHEVAGVYAPPSVGSRSDPLAAEAGRRGILVRTPASYKGAEIAREVRDLGAELGLLAFVTKIIPPAVIDAPRLGTLCFHPSLLPRYRGGSALAWQLIRGETRGGFTVFWTDPGIDTGPILLQREVAIGPDDTAGTLYFEKIFAPGIDAMVEAVDLVARGNPPRIPQDESRATYDPLCTDEHAAVRWEMPPTQLYDLIRGCDPQPGAHAAWRGAKLRLYDAKRTGDRVPGTAVAPGTVVALDEDGLLVAAGEGHAQGLLRIGRLRGPGPKASAREVAATLAIPPGSRLSNGVV